MAGDGDDGRWQMVVIMAGGDGDDEGADGDDGRWQEMVIMAGGKRW